MKIALMSWILSSLLVFIVNAQDDVRYRFPDVVGTELWKEIPAYQDRLKFYDIPDDTLKNMSTKRLTQACLDYPELRLIMTRNDLQSGFAYVYSIFNGFRELGNRKDSGTALMTFYEQVDVNKITKLSSLIEQGDFSFSLTYIEILLSHSEIIEKLNKEEKRKLISLALMKHQEKTKHLELYASFGLTTTTWIIAKVLQSEPNTGIEELRAQYPSIDYLLRYGLISDESAINSLLTLGKRYE